MEYRTFKKIIDNILKADKRLDKIYKVGIDLTNFIEPYNVAIFNLFKAYYGKEGNDLIQWFLYEKNCDKNNSLKAYDKNGQEICKTLHELWALVEKIKENI